jgi:hypothetical protein
MYAPPIQSGITFLVQVKTSEFLGAYMPKNKKSKISVRHYVTLSDATGVTSTISIYGKLIRDVPLDPSVSGVSHPKTPGGGMVVGQVFGFVDRGQCQKVAPPVIVSLPEPDGPADGCGWDPGEYVVWKNLPRNWVTLHLHVEPRTLSDVLSKPLAFGIRARAVPTIPGVQDRVVEIVKSWAKMQTNPQGTDPLQALWAASHPSGPFSDAAQDLATQINNAFGTHLLGSDINPPGSIKTVNDLVDAVS